MDGAKKPLTLWDADTPNKHIIDYKWQERQTDGLIFIQGQRLPYTYPGGAFPTHQDPATYDLIYDSLIPPERFLKYDYLPTNGGSPVVNQRTLALLQSICPNDFQAFPVTIRNDKKAKLPDFENHDYVLINITTQQDLIDREQSVLTYYESGKIKDIKRLVLKSADHMGGVHLARERGYHSLPLVSPVLAAAFKKAKIKGCVFLQDYEAYPYTPPEQRLVTYYAHDPEASKRFFLSLLCHRENLEELKRGVHKMPRDILEALIEMTLSKSSLHQQECEELLRLASQERV